jgi:integrase
MDAGNNYSFGEGLCMQGRIYTEQKCFFCAQKGQPGKLNHIEGRGFLQCPIHLEVKWTGLCIVRFGRSHTKRFKTVEKGERHLTSLRYQLDQGKVFDQREWAKTQPLSFLALREKFLKSKDVKDITDKQKVHIGMVLGKAGEEWDRMQIKDIMESEIDDFFIKIKKGRGNKTLANYKTVLHDFWAWVVKREKRKSKLEMPGFPDITYKLGWRTIVKMEDQKKILDELWEITENENPRIWLGVKLLSMYPKVRPGEMRDIKEGHINLSDGWIFFPDPKEGDKGKFVHLAPKDCQLIESLWNPKGLPGMFFFRHLKSKKGTKAGKRFGPKYFKVWWDKACKNVGIENVDLYGGTKHSTVTALGQLMTPEQIQRGVTGHASDAFKRYMLPDVNEAIIGNQNVAKIQGGTEQRPNNLLTLEKKTN